MFEFSIGVVIVLGIFFGAMSMVTPWAVRHAKPHLSTEAGMYASWIRGFIIYSIIGSVIYKWVTSGDLTIGFI